MPPSAAGPGSPSAPREAKVRTPEEIEARREKSRAKHAAYRAEGKPSHRLTVAERKARTAARTGQPVPAAKKGAPEKLSVPRIAEALAKTGGLIGPAAEFLQYPRSSVVHYVERYASLQRVQSQAREHALDDTEWALIKAARAGEPWAVQWFLKYQGKERGYQEVRKTEQDATVRVEVAYTEDALGAGRPTTTVTQLAQLPPPDGAAEGGGSAESSQYEQRVEVVEAEVSYPPEDSGG